MKYQSTVPFRLRSAQVWLVTLPDGRQFIEVVAPDLSVEAIHMSIRHRHRDFTMQQVTVGQLWIESAESMFMADGRELNQDWNVSVGGGTRSTKAR